MIFGSEPADPAITEEGSKPDGAITDDGGTPVGANTGLCSD